MHSHTSVPLARNLESSNWVFVVVPEELIIKFTIDSC